MIYLDHAATTPVDPRVIRVMTESLERGYANPSAIHGPGQAARKAVELARSEVARVIGGRPGEVLFTSGATEADNLALMGMAPWPRDPAAHLVTSRIEHRAVLDCARHWESTGGAVSYVGTDRLGRVSISAVEAALRPTTRLVSIMLVNNETGVVQDLAAIAAVCRSRGVLLHTDAAQAVGHVPLDVQTLNVDLMSFSAHKLGGPAGIGALWVGARAAHTLYPILHGGGQEKGLRPGTLPVHQIMGMGEACRIAREQIEGDAARQRQLTEQLAERLMALTGVVCNGGAAARAPHILNLSFAGVDGESLHASLEGVAVSGGSACGAERGEPSYVLRALGLSDAAAEASVRFSVGRQTTDNCIENASKIVEKAVLRLRALGPV
jgi:cysteine desulfurase